MKNLLKNLGHSFLKNLKLIIISVIISVILWFAVSIQIFPDIKSHINDIPVNIILPTQMLENNLQIQDETANTVSIQIQGKRYEIGKLSTEDFYASLDLSNITAPGEYNVDVIVQNENQDSAQCEILSKDLTQKIKVVKIVTKEFELIPTSGDIKTSEGLKIDSEDFVVNPGTVSITGEEKLVNSIAKAEAVALYNDVIETTTEVKGELRLYNHNDVRIENPDLTVSTDSFTITIPVYRVKTLPLAVSFTNVPQNFDIESLKYKIFPEEITIASPDNSIEKLDQIEIGDIQLSRVSSRELKGITIPIVLPEGYKNISKAATALITFDNVDNYGQLNFTVPKENFNIINSPTEYDVSILTNQLPVTVIAPSNVLTEMSSTDINVIINLLGTELSEGTKSISVTNFQIIGSNVSGWVSGEYKIDILITPKS